MPFTPVRWSVAAAWGGGALLALALFAGAAEAGPKALSRPDPLGKVALNPQPLPPRWLSKVHSGHPRGYWRAGPLGVGPGGKVSLNPQPLPPKVLLPQFRVLGR